MASVIDIRKKAEKILFINKLQNLGFDIGKDGFWFYRLRDGYIDYIGFHLKSSRSYMAVPVTCLKCSIISHCDMKEFPVGFEKEMPFYSSTYINEEYGVEIGSDPWKIETESDIEESLNNIYELIESSADKWFREIDSDVKLYNSFTINFRKSDKAKELKKILVG